jgi:hypothetical protein
MPFGAFGALAVLLRALRVFAAEKNRNAPIRPALLLVTQVNGAVVQAIDGHNRVEDLVPHIGEDLEVLAEAGAAYIDSRLWSFSTEPMWA